jgi:hypothetical protein
MEKKTKDFVLFTFTWTCSSRTYFQYFKDKGHDVDIVNEHTYKEFCEKDEFNYKNIILYLHWKEQLEVINPYIMRHPEAFLIQHDDGDEQHLVYWTPRHPSIIMKREYTENTVLQTPAIVYPMHFPMNSIWNPEKYPEKKYDVAFVCGITNHKRTALIHYLQELQKTKYKHLKFFFDTAGAPVTGDATEMFREAYNCAKIGIHYFGNSRDSTRVWEIMSCQTALLMPKYRLKIAEEPYMPLDHSSYESMEDDWSDIEQKIDFLLENDNWKKVAERGQKEFQEHQSIQKSCEYYYDCVMRHCNK